MRISDWSSDVCSSDLAHRLLHGGGHAAELAALEAARRAASLRQPLVPFGKKDSVAEDSAHDVVELAFLVVQPVVLQDVADHLRLVQHQNLVETEAQLDGIAVIAGDAGEEAQRIDRKSTRLNSSH